MHNAHLKKIRASVAAISMLALIGSGMFGFSFVPFLKGQTVSANTFSITGVVFAPDGTTPIAGAHPYAQTMDRIQYFPGNETGADGAFTIANVPPGTYIVAANPPDGVAGLGRSNDQVEYVTSSNVTRNIVLNGTPKTITGTITYVGTTTPVVGAYINVWSNNGGPGGQATTNSSGVYSISLAPNTQYQVNLSAAEGADWSYNAPPYMVSFAADSSTESRTANFQVTKATATITGTVTYASTGAVLTTGNVNAWMSNGNGGGANAQVKPDGTYTLRVPAGMFNINYWNPDQSLTAAPTMVSVQENQTVTANIVIKVKTAHITGKTVDVNGNPLKGIRMHAWCQPLGIQNGGPTPGIDGNDESDLDGSFDLALLAGNCNINIDQWGMNDPNAASYVLSGQVPQVVLDTDTTSKNIGNITLAKADATIRVTVKDEAGNPVTGINGFINAQKAETTQMGPGENYGGPLQPDGKAIIKLPSSVFSLVRLNMFMGPDSQYSVSDVGATVTVVANGTTDAVLTLVKNNSSIYGSLVDSNGVPLTKCNPPAGQFTFGEVFVNNTQNNTFRNAQFKEDCSYRVSVTAGKYFFNWHFSNGSGLLNGNPSPDPVEVKAGQNVAKNIVALIGDAKISVQVLDPTGAPVVNTWVDAGNEIELFGRPGGPGPDDQGPKDLGKSTFKDKNGKSGDPFRICSEAIKKNDKKQMDICRNTKLPEISEGPGGCKNVLTCVQFCSKPENQAECGKFKGPESGPNGGPQTGPGGCKSQTECEAYCSKPENQTECSKFGPPSGSMTGAAFTKGTVKGESTSTGDRAMGGGPKPEDFKNVLHSGNMTDTNGRVTLSVVSGHKYEVRANPQPGSSYMPAKSQVVDFTKGGKSVSIVLALREADAKITGKVTGGGPFGFCHAFSDDNNFSGGEVRNGSYQINVSKGVWHVGCDSAWDNNFARSDEVTVVVDGSKKTITQNFKLSANSNFRIPPAFTTSFDATAAQTIVLEDGTTIVAPASAFATSGTITLVATPTANLQSQLNAKPAWYGYELTAKDSNGATITKFNSSVTVIFKYTDSMIEASGIDENALLPKYYDESTNTWQSPSNVTQDTTNNTITVVTDHFSKHALTYTASAVSKISVTKGVGKKNLGKITMGKKTVTAFSGTKLNVATAVFGGSKGQLVFVSPAETLKKGSSVVKIYNAKTGKLVKTINPFGGNGAITLTLADVTKDGKGDVAMSQPTNPEVKVLDAMNKYKVYTINTNAPRNSTVTVASLEAQQVGFGNLTTLIQRYGKNDLTVYQFNKGFKVLSGLDENSKRVRISGTSVSLVVLKPAATKVNGTLKTTNAKAVLTIFGENFNRDTVVTVQNKPVSKVKFINGGKIQITVNGTVLSKGKAAIKFVNLDGGTTTWSKLTAR